MADREQHCPACARADELEAAIQSLLRLRNQADGEHFADLYVESQDLYRRIREHEAAGRNQDALFREWLDLYRGVTACRNRLERRTIATGNRIRETDDTYALADAVDRQFWQGPNGQPAGAALANPAPANPAPANPAPGDAEPAEADPEWLDPPEWADPAGGEALEQAPTLVGDNNDVGAAAAADPAPAPAPAPAPPAPPAFDLAGLEYVQDVNENLLCPICREPFVKPAALRGCEHVFCAACLAGWRAAAAGRPQCPTCRGHIARTGGTRRPHALLRAMLDELVVRCPRHDRGCPATMQRDRVAAHVREACEHGPAAEADTEAAAEADVPVADAAEADAPAADAPPAAADGPMPLPEVEDDPFLAIALATSPPGPGRRVTWWIFPTGEQAPQ